MGKLDHLPKEFDRWDSRYTGPRHVSVLALINLLYKLNAISRWRTNHQMIEEARKFARRHYK